ncbi:hypothetical protein F5X99DRAFT_412763 [Biscogniauxia marginata]|nr:hypothetical protein F5X99DRAFT_412763 [Biscogniauxia marginata]
MDSADISTWLPAEDAELREAVAKHGSRWAEVARDVRTRNGDECAKRWHENLNPELNHRPWTSEEEFMAKHLTMRRTPLSLKHRHSLLMRRHKRQRTTQQQSSGSASPAPARAVDHTSYDFTGDAAETTSQQGEAGAGGTLPQTTTTPTHWTEVDFGGQQDAPSQFFFGLDNMSSGTEIGGEEIDVDKTTMAAKNDSTSNLHPHRSRDGEGLPTGEGSSTAAAPVEYSVTCQRGKLKTLVNHLIDAAMMEGAGSTADDDQVTVTLQFKA